MSAKTDPTVKKLAASIVQFLQDSQKNGTLDAEDAESMEVATGIISEAFGLGEQTVGPVNLLQVFEVYEKTRERMVHNPSPPQTTSILPLPSSHFLHVGLYLCF